MNRFWPLAAALLDAIHARRLCEIGAERGTHTRLMIEYCRARSAFLEVIDPLPLFDVEAWVAEHPQIFRVHPRTSLEALPEIDPCDAYFVDGDHNYYTVTRELRSIEERAEPGREPLVLLHDTAWPYGRRDLYYAPERIPAEHRLPFEPRPMLPGCSELVEVGLNAGLCNAVREGGPANGVLTAVEDHVLGSARRYEVVTLELWHGLTIIASRARVSAEPALALVLDRARAIDTYGLVARAERERVALMIAENAARASKREAQAPGEAKTSKAAGTGAARTRKSARGQRHTAVRSR